MKRIFFTLLIGTLSHSVYARLPGAQVPCQTAEYTNGSHTSCINGLQNTPGNKEFLILEFASYYCGACRSSIPRIEHIIRKTQHNSVFRVVARGDEAAVEKLASKYSPSIPVAYDTQKTLQKIYDVVYVPTILVIDRANRVLYRHRGLVTDEVVADVLQATRNS